MHIFNIIRNDCQEVTDYKIKTKNNVNCTEQHLKQIQARDHLLLLERVTRSTMLQPNGIE